MKKKFAIINFLLGFVVLFSILFQSLHSYEHLAKQISEKHCYHKITANGQITHQHHNFDKCLICEVTFSHFTTTEFYAFKVKKTFTPSRYSLFYSKEISQFFKGSLFALRAPPIV